MVRRIDAPVGRVDSDEANADWPSASDSFGHDLGVLRTGDGYALLVAAPDEDRDRGEVHVYLDAQDGPSDAALVVRGSAQGNRLGDAIHVCPDWTGDGIGEVVVTSPWIRTPEELGDAEIPSLAGAVIYLTSEALLGARGTQRAAALGTIWWGDAVGDGAGTGVDCSQDLNADGVVDLVVGAPNAETTTGKVYILSGADLPASAPLGEAAIAIIDGDPGDALGASIAAGLRDGRPTLLLGAPGFDAGVGRAVLIDANGVFNGITAPVASFESDRTTADHLGRTVATADLDGDGINEWLVGGPDLRQGQIYDIGQVLVFGGTGDWSSRVGSEEADLQITDDQGFRRVGLHIVVHDLDNDGIDDLLLPTRAPRSR